MAQDCQWSPRMSRFRKSVTLIIKPVTAGPNDHGFDYSFILPGSLDMFPYVYLRNQRFLGKVNKMRGWSAFNRVGPTEENFEDYEVLQTFRKVNQFIARNAKDSKNGNHAFFILPNSTSPPTSLILTFMANRSGCLRRLRS